jgi:hypothetical protein
LRRSKIARHVSWAFVGVVDAMIFISSKAVGELIDSTKTPTRSQPNSQRNSSELKLEQDHFFRTFRLMLPLDAVLTFLFESKFQWHADKGEFFIIGLEGLICRSYDFPHPAKCL